MGIRSGFRPDRHSAVDRKSCDDWQHLRLFVFRSLTTPTTRTASRAERPTTNFGAELALGWNWAAGNPSLSRRRLQHPHPIQVDHTDNTGQKARVRKTESFRLGGWSYCEESLRAFQRERGTKAPKAPSPTSLDRAGVFDWEVGALGETGVGDGSPRSAEAKIVRAQCRGLPRRSTHKSWELGMMDPITSARDEAVFSRFHSDAPFTPHPLPPLPESAAPTRRRLDRGHTRRSDSSPVSLPARRRSPIRLHPSK